MSVNILNLSNEKVPVIILVQNNLKDTQSSQIINNLFADTSYSGAGVLIIENFYKKKKEIKKNKNKILSEKICNNFIKLYQLENNYKKLGLIQILIDSHQKKGAYGIAVNSLSKREHLKEFICTFVESQPKYLGRVWLAKKMQLKNIDFYLKLTINKSDMIGSPYNDQRKQTEIQILIRELTYFLSGYIQAHT